MFSWAGGLGSGPGPGHSLGAVDGSETSFSSDIWDNTTHVPRKGNLPGDAVDLADVLSSQAEINRLLREIEALEAEVTYWKKWSQSSTQGQNTIDSDTLWKLRSTIRDLEERRMRELDEHQLQVAALKNIHEQKLADLVQRHRQEVIKSEKQLGDLQRLRRQNRAIPKLLDDLIELECEVSQLKERNEGLEEEVKEQQVMIHNQQQGKIALLQALQEQKQKVDHLQNRQEQMNAEHAQLLSASDEQIQNFRSQVRENELLRQAVTHLKERIADFEMDVCQLKEENAKIVERSRKKELENQALQETNRLLSVGRREEDSQHAAMKEKALALEQPLPEKEETGELNRLADAVPSMQEKTAVCQQETDEVVLALQRKEMETCALQKEVHQLGERELGLTQELERWRHLASEAEESRRREALASEDKVAQLRKEVTVLQGKLVLSSTAMEKASRGASVQVASLREQLHVVAQQKEENGLRLAASQEEGKRCAQSLANLKLELAEWMEKADSLGGKVKSLQGRLHQTNADLDLKEDQLQAFKKQNEVQQEILEDTQRKLMTFVSHSEDMVDKTLLRRLFMGSFQAPDAERQEALRLMGSTLGIREDQLRQLFAQEPAGVTHGVTAGPGCKSAPNTPAKPSHQAVASNSFSGLFVQFLEAESHSAFPPPTPSARDVKPPHSGGRGKLAKKPGPPPLTTSLGSTAGRKDVKPCTTAVSLINPPGPETDGSEHLLLSAVTDALPRYMPQILSPAKEVGVTAKGLSKK